MFATLYYFDTVKMGNMLENHFNRRNHVANASGVVILAKVINDKASQTLRDAVEAEFKGIKIGKTNTRELTSKHGFTSIAPNSYLAFAPDAERTAYISICTEGGQIIIQNYPVHENRSVIVNSEGYLREAEYGTIWTER